MNKKLLSLLFASTLLLSACGEEGTDEPTEAEAETATETEEVEDTQTEEAEKTEDTEQIDEETEEQDVLAEGDTEETEYGTMTRVVEPFEINETQESGPFEITVQKAQLGQIQPTEEYIDLFGGEDVALVSLLVEATNNSDDTNTIYPDQGTIVTDTGKQIDADLWFSEDVGGDFLGQVTKDGEVWFLFEGDASEVSNVRYIIDSGHDEDWESFSDDLEFSIDF